jgi:hypothetical protein
MHIYPIFLVRENELEPAEIAPGKSLKKVVLETFAQEAHELNFHFAHYVDFNVES